MTELYTMQRYLQPHRLKTQRINSFDNWASNFGKITTAIELSPEGKGFRSKTRFAKFYNLPELISLFKEIADIKTPEMLNLPVPKAEYIISRIKASTEQKELVDNLAKRADSIRKGLLSSEDDNKISINKLSSESTARLHELFTFHKKDNLIP